MAQVRVATFDGPGADPVIREVPWPKISGKAALIQIGACGVCGTDLHILKGHWPKPLPWPFTLGHEMAGVIVEKGPDLKTDWMDRPIEVGSKIMIPPFMPCGELLLLQALPEHSNRCQTPVYYGRYLGFESRPISGAGGPSTSMSTSTCCRGRKSISSPTPCRCASARCRSRSPRPFVALRAPNAWAGSNGAIRS